MENVIVYTDAEGRCCLVCPAPEMFDADSRTRRDLRERGIDFRSDAEIVKWIAAKDVPPGLEWSIRKKADIPTNRTFREAWKNGAKSVCVDMEKARAIHMGRLRQLRNAKLAALDVDYQRADEEGHADRKAEIAAKKRALRDMPQQAGLEAIKSPEELRDYLPESLLD